MRNFLAFFLATVVLSSCTTQAPQKAPHVDRPAFVESVTSLPDGAKEIVVSGQFTVATNNGQVQSVNLGQRLEQAAKAECNGGPYQLTPSSSTGIAPGQQGPLKLTLKGVVHCG